MYARASMAPRMPATIASHALARPLIIWALCAGSAAGIHFGGKQGDQSMQLLKVQSDMGAGQAGRPGRQSPSAARWPARRKARRPRPAPRPGPLNYWHEPTPSPTAEGGSAQATGDPHLTNVLGQRFDLRKEGWHTLVRVPQGAKRGAALLSVEAEARQMGVACADLYFQSVNLTGRYVGSQGRAFNAGRVAKKDSQRWLRYGMVELKVVQGHTKSGIVYLNLFVRHLKSAGYPVGGILGMDDHTAAAEPSLKCQMRISLLAIDGPVLNPEKASIAAADLE